MTTIKSYTDLKQSKVLSKILSFKSADMCYKCMDEDPYDVCLRPYSEWKEEYKGLLVNKEVDVIPCWSLTALLNVLPKEEYKDISLCFGGYQGDKFIPEWFCSYEQQEPFLAEYCHADNSIDAVYEMVLKLHELNLL